MEHLEAILKDICSDFKANLVEFDGEMDTDISRNLRGGLYPSPEGLGFTPSGINPLHLPVLNKHNTNYQTLNPRDIQRKAMDL